MELGHMNWRKASYSGSNGQCVEVGTWRKASRSASNGQCVEVGTWRKASRSTSNGQCIEVGTRSTAGEDTLCLVRDSKDRNGPALAFTATGWNTFIADVKNGKLDHI